MQVHREREAIRARGADLVFIGNGNRHFAEAFRAANAIESPLYVDTKRGVYQALGMHRGVFRVVSPGGIRNALRALQGGFRQDGIKGDAWQLGGVLAVAPGARLLYAYLSEAVGDHPPVADVLAALPA